MNRAPAPRSDSPSGKAEPTVAVVLKESYYFCEHPRSKFTTKNAVCKGCREPSHFKQVCRPKPTPPTIKSAVYSIPSCLLVIAYTYTMWKCKYSQTLRIPTVTPRNRSYTITIRKMPCGLRITMASISLPYDYRIWHGGYSLPKRVL